MTTASPAGKGDGSRTKACRRVLVAEAEAVISLDLTRTLKGLGYAVPGVAQTAQQAVEMALRCKPDLVLMDIWLNGARDGIEAAAELRRRIDVPIVFAMAHADAETVRRAVETDPAGFVMKPFSSADLRLQLEIAFARRPRAPREGKQAAKASPAPEASLQLSAVAHDFNNLLTLIMANADALRAHGDSKEVEQIRRASQLATMLCRQLLPTPGALRSSGWIDLNAVLESQRNLIERAAGERCSVAFGAAAELLPVAADEGQISRIFINLALNAQRAMPNGGKLSISTRKLTRSLAELCITDTGVGMDASVLQRVFDPFFSGNSGGGSGLGLTIVQGIVSQIGGTISVESEPGGGTSFTILVPLAQKGGAPERRTRTEVRRKTPVRASVLLVEDHPDIRALVGDQLEFAGIECISAGDADEAMAALGTRAAPVEILVTDLSLPGVGGAELATACLERGLCSRVLFISGYAGESGSLTSAVLRERGEFLAKPFTAAEVTARVRAILHSMGS